MNDKKNKDRQSFNNGKIVYFPAKKNRGPGGFPFLGSGKSKEPFFNFGIIPPFTKTVFWLMLAIYAGTFFLLDDGNKFSMFYKFGFIPDNFTKLTNFTYLALLTPVTSLFIHSSWMHLIFNLLMLLCMGFYFEKVFGTKKTILFFLTCGLVGNFCYLVLSPYSALPVVGASGAINGLFAFTFLHMHRIGMMGPAMTEKGPLPFILLWLSLILVTGAIGGDISWQSHLGGFLAGVVIFNLWRNGYIKA